MFQDCSGLHQYVNYYSQWKSREKYLQQQKEMPIVGEDETEKYTWQELVDNGLEV